MVRTFTATILCLALFAAASSAQQSAQKRSAVQESTAQRSEPAKPKSTAVPRRVSVGDNLPEAIQRLAAAGITQSSEWQMGPRSRDLEITWRDIEQGVTLAITYQVKTKKITNLQMMYVPPVYNRKGNIRFLSATSLQFHADGAYSVRYAKPPELAR